MKTLVMTKRILFFVILCQNVFFLQIAVGKVVDTVQGLYNLSLTYSALTLRHQCIYYTLYY